MNNTENQTNNEIKPEKLDKVQAWNILSQVCAQYKGTLQEHQLLQKSLSLLQPEITIN